MAKANGNGSKYHVPNLDRALSILELLSRHPAGLIKGALARELAISPNTVYRITTTLLDRGYLESCQRTRRLRLSNKMMDLRLACVLDRSIVDTSWDVMCELRDVTTETVHLEALLDGEGVVLEEAEGLHSLRFTVDLGTRFELHAAAPGKVFLAFMGERERARLLSRLKFTRYNRRTITSRAKLAKELDLVRKRGYTLDRAEVVDGIHCVSAPIFGADGSVAAAITVTGPVSRLPEKMFARTGRHVMEHARRISKRLGYVRE
ncbi:MAG: IclR family transcriptional regulator [Planctomycetota bacterium]